MLATLRAVALLAAVLAAGAALPPGGSVAQGPDAAKPPPSSVPFDQARGTLPWPVAGVLASGFGQPTGDGKLSRAS